MWESKIIIAFMSCAFKVSQVCQKTMSHICYLIYCLPIIFDVNIDGILRLTTLWNMKAARDCLAVQ